MLSGIELLIRTERLKRGMSLQALADKAGVTKRALTYWESGTRKMSMESAEKLCKALNITYVIGGTGSSRK